MIPRFNRNELRLLVSNLLALSHLLPLIWKYFRHITAWFFNFFLYFPFLLIACIEDKPFNWKKSRIYVLLFLIVIPFLYGFPFYNSAATLNILFDRWPASWICLDLRCPTEINNRNPCIFPEKWLFINVLLSYVEILRIL